MSKEYDMTTLINRIAYFMKWQQICGKVKYISKSDSTYYHSSYEHYEWEDKYIQIIYTTEDSRTDFVSVSLIRKHWFRKEYEMVLKTWDRFHGQIYRKGQWVEHLVQITEGAREAFNQHETEQKEKREAKKREKERLRRQKNSRPIDDSDVFRK